MDSESLEQGRHRGGQPARNYLQRNDPDLTLSSLNIRNVASVNVQVYGHVSLRPSLLLPRCSDTPSKLDQQGMIAAGH